MKTIRYPIEKLKATPVVLYGAGGQAAIELPEMREMGIVPVCFCDQDVSKQGTKYLELPILSVRQVLEQFQGKPFFIYITVADEQLFFSIQHDLTSTGIFDQSQIVNWVEAKKCKSCPRIENQVFLMRDGLTCCPDEFPYVRNMPMIPVTGNFEETFQQYLSARAQLHLENQGPNPPCGQCIYLEEKYWKQSPKLESIGISHFMPCQFNCSYCTLGNTAHLLKDGPVQYYDGLKFLQYLQEAGYFSPEIVLSYGGGELSLNPEQNQIIDFMACYSARSQIYTNCAKYIPAIGQLPDQLKKKFIIMPSIDSGTRETFRSVKGVDLFDAFLNTVEQYVQHNIQVWLKYLIMPENSNLKDIAGFLSICDRFQIRNIVVSGNLYTHNNEYQENFVETAFLLIKGAQERKIVWSTFDGYFGKENSERLHAKLHENGII